ncbi:hypothetical protein ACJJTC_003628 [Scirpophaga incertulas]
MAGKTTKKTAEQKKKERKEAERRRRARIKEDPIKYEEHLAKEKARRQKRKEEGKTKGIKDMTMREQRAQRREWLERTRKSRLKKKNAENLMQQLRADSPPSDSDQSRLDISVQREPSPGPSFLQSPNAADRPSSSASSSSCMSRQKLAGKKICRKNNYLKDKIIKKQKAVIELMKKKLSALAAKNKRLEKQKPPPIRKTLNTSLSRHLRNKIAIQQFLEKDENSKICPGKRDTITKRGKKMQKRYLSDTLFNLHKKYNSKATYPISYPTFTRYRPFWIVAPCVSARDTCLCIVHENFNLICQKLKQLEMIEESSLNCVCDAMVCSQTNIDCMTRNCETCRDRCVCFKEFDGSENITYKQWLNITETRTIKGQEKDIRRTVKTAADCTKRELVNTFFDMVPKFLKHKYNIWHQYQAIHKVKQQLKPGEVLLHIDFSENYQCKYASETQSVHFGASRQQLSLHTCVLYYCDVPGTLKTISFCSVSDCLRHDAAAIYAHLKKSLRYLRQDRNLIITTLHVLSDGPSGQYKNKTNCFLFTQHLVHDLSITNATWNFSEAGHGKGAADGVGAVVKRTADSLIAQGHDIPDFSTFVAKIIIRTNILLYTVFEADITIVDEMIPKKLKPIPETTKIHQITWSRENPRKIYLRYLSCSICPVSTTCSHYPIQRGYYEYDDVIAPEDNTIEENNDIVQVDQLPDEPRQSCTKNDEVSIKTGSWVGVMFEGKKSTIHFVGQVTSIEQEKTLAYTVKFLRKKYLSVDSGTFVWQEPEDVSLVTFNDIAFVLPEPTPTRRGELVFDYDFSKLNTLK